MGKAKKTRKFAAVKRMLNPNDIRLKENQIKQKRKEEEAKEKAERRVTQVASSLFLQHNDALVPPYRVIIDTNFINFSLQNKIELVSGMMDCLFAKCIPCVTDCVLAELEKLDIVGLLGIPASNVSPALTRGHMLMTALYNE
ncbi:hypothetical protein EIP86_011144 [Pleurotus ostreatoroseus]|nr:hypothetical protein EIP86_011144 [Pleurotus ostreatoroseus]